MFPRFIFRPFCRPGHVLDIQVLKRYQSVVFAYVVRDLLKMVQTVVGDLNVDGANQLLLFPVIS
jgi:hypothetical protein